MRAKFQVPSSTWVTHWTFVVLLALSPGACVSSTKAPGGGRLTSAADTVAWRKTGNRELGTGNPSSVAIPMPDGVILRGYLLLPHGVPPFPVIVYRTPYGVTSTVESSALFKKGHRIRLTISTTFFPHFSRNLHTGELETTSSRMRKARITIHHNARHASRLILPVMRRGAGREVRAAGNGQARPNGGSQP